MKKYFFIFSLFLVFIILTGCSKKEQVVKVRMPIGAPTLGFVEMMHNHKKILDYKIDYESIDGTDLLQSAITSKSHEIVIAPTNFGAKLYTEKDSGYIYAGTITLGNLYLVSNEEITFDDLTDQTIHAFGKGGVPDILLNEFLKEKTNLTIDVTGTANTVSSQFISDTNEGTLNISLLAEPSLSKVKEVLDEKTVYTVLDLQTAYKNLRGVESYPQAGLFINEAFAKENQAFVDEFLKVLDESIQSVNDNKEQASDDYIEERLSPTFKKTVLMRSIPGCNLDFLDAQGSKPLIEDYFNLLIETNKSALIGGSLPDDDFYLD